jgi:ABC-type nitrate/sulfonate/bicarbonate transport system substrate-binding protein
MRQKNYLLFISFAFAFLIQSCSNCNKKKVKGDELTLADASVSWWMAPGIIAQVDSIYSKNNLKVTSFDVQTGLASKNAVVSGTADIGFVATTPLALGALYNENLIVLCSYIESNSLISVITTALDDTSLYSKPKAPIAVVKGTISELYLYNYFNNYFPDDIDKTMKDQLNVKPPDIPNTINRNAKSACIWEPFATIMKDNDSTLKINRPENIYTHRIYIITTPKVLKEKKQAVEKFVKSIQLACEFIGNNKEKAQQVITAKFPQQRKSMSLLWDKVNFSLKYDYSNMQELMLKDANVMTKLKQTPSDGKGSYKRAEIKDFSYYFDHNFKTAQ